MEEEKKIFEEYSEWVDDQVRDKGYEIQTFTDQVAKLKAEIGKADADVHNLSEQLTNLMNDITKWKAEALAATEIREAGKKEYDLVSADYGESIDAIERAKNVLQQKAFDREQAENLLQIVSVVPEAHKALTAFLQSADISTGAPAVAGYEFQSGGIIKMLEGLKKKFRQELSDASKEEANAAHAYDMKVLNLRDQTKNAEDQHAEKEGERSRRKTDGGEYRASLADTENVLAETQKYTRNVQTTYEIKSRDFKQNQDVRKEELVALTKATEIIGGESVSGAADKHLPALVQKRSFLQTQTFLGMTSSSVNAAKYLEQRAKKLNSKALQMAAIQMSSGGAFDKIAKIIKDLITRLETEAAEEADHNAFCNEELKQNKLTREAKTRKSEELNTKIAKLTSNIDKLAEQISELNAQIAALQKAMKKYTTERAEEKKTNETTISDAKEAQVALAQALDVLKQFYEKSGGEPALVQVTHKQVPELAPYTGQKSSSGGVLGILEVIQTDFARLQADTESAENQAQKEYEDYMKDSKEDSEVKHKDSFDKKMLKDRKEHERKLTNKDLRSVTEELNAANDYYDELKPQCLEVHVSHEERMRLRQEEIESLEQAYEILSAKK